MASISKNSGMEENWKKNLATDSYGNPVRSISNLRLIFTLDEKDTGLSGKDIQNTSDAE